MTTPSLSARLETVAPTVRDASTFSGTVVSGAVTSGAPNTVLPPSTTHTADTPATATDLAVPSTADTAPASTGSAGSTPPEGGVISGGEVTESTSATTPLPSGAVVVIDPGHNGGNAAHPEIINKQVPAGFGQMKACNTTGTATASGYPEHALNWAVAKRLRALLQDAGITVLMTRDSDDGVGPCVDERAAIGNEAHADAVISIHGDGADASVRGFFVMTASRTEAPDAVDARTDGLAVAVRDAMAGAGFPVSNGLGRDGLWARSDLGGLNLSLVPTVMIELGNMRNPAEAKRLSGKRGQARYAEALAAGVEAFLAQR